MQPVKTLPELGTSFSALAALMAASASFLALVVTPLALLAAVLLVRLNIARA